MTEHTATPWQRALNGLDAMTMTNKPEHDRDPTPISPIADIRAAIVFLTRLPVGGPHRAVSQNAWAFPLAGLLVGALGGTVFLAASWVGWSPWIAAFLTLATTAIITGGLHEDGLADSADGLGAGGSRDRRLEIMRDSRIGGYGAIALVLATGMKASALAAFGTLETLDQGAVPSAALGMLVLISTHSLSRGVLPLVMAILTPASASGVAASVGRPGLVTAIVALMLGGCIAVLALGPLGGLIALCAAAITAFLVALFLMRRLGGYNGDTLGLLEQLCEIAIMLALLATPALSSDTQMWRVELLGG